jgi:predicted enzyme related to lactoylglutathione lyase
VAQALSISLIAYPVWDAEKSFDFFTNVLGFYPQRRDHKIQVGCGDTLIEFKAAEPGAEAVTEKPESYVFTIAVNDLEETVAELEKVGVKVTRPIWGGHTFWGRQAVITVPGGPQIGLREWRAPDGPHFNDWHAEESGA